MTLVLGEWRESKVRPIPGNVPHDRPVSRGIVSSKSICDDSLRTTRFPQRHRKRRDPPACVFSGMAESIGPMWRKNQTRAGIDCLPPVGPDPGRRTRREDHALLIVRDEFRPAIP